MDIRKMRESFVYDKDSGRLTWAKSKGAARAGGKAGCIGGNGYLQVGFDNEILAVHRIIWAMEYGEVPLMIDHINGDRTDNRLSNLRNVSNTLNQHNRNKPRKDSKQKYVGISFYKASKTWNKDKWKATIRVHGKRISLGYFDSPEMASLAYQKAKAKFHPYYFNCKNAEALE